MTRSISFFSPLLSGVARTYRSRVKRMRITGGAAGVALTATGLSAADKLISLEILPGTRLLNERITTSTAKGTSSTAEQVLDSYSFAAGKFIAGKKYKVTGAIRVSASHSTDTFTFRVRLGATTLTGDVLCTAAARDAADEDVVVFNLELTVRSVTSVYASGSCSASGAAGTAALAAAFKAATVTTNATTPTLLEVTVQCSVSDAGNAAVLERFSITETTADTMTHIDEDEVTFGADTLTLSTTATAGQTLELLYIDLTP